jgi:hypothetical protein
MWVQLKFICQIKSLKSWRATILARIQDKKFVVTEADLGNPKNFQLSTCHGRLFRERMRLFRQSINE